MRTTRLIALAAALPLPAFAHDGHGIAASSHWHPTDSAGLLLVVALALGAAWWGRRK
jgi:hypothetical protein